MKSSPDVPPAGFTSSYRVIPVGLIDNDLSSAPNVGAATRPGSLPSGDAGVQARCWSLLRRRAPALRQRVLEVRSCRCEDGIIRIQGPSPPQTDLGSSELRRLLQVQRLAIFRAATTIRMPERERNCSPAGVELARSYCERKADARAAAPGGQRGRGMSFARYANGPAAQMVAPALVSRNISSTLL